MQLLLRMLLLELGLNSMYPINNMVSSFIITSRIHTVVGEKLETKLPSRSDEIAVKEVML